MAASNSMKKITNKPYAADYAYFKDVAKNQQTITPQEEEKLFKDYSKLEENFRLILLSNQIVRDEIINLINEIKEKNRSIAKLHSRFDNKKTGHNKKIIDEMNTRFGKIIANQNAYNIEKQLYDMSFSKEVYDTIYTNFFNSLPDSQQIILKEIKEKIKAIENKLTCSVLKMAISIAQKYTANIFGMNIKDAIQETTIGIFECIRLYNPDYRSKNGKKIKFATYANIKAEKKLKEKIMETSRLIKLPKSRLDVLFVVLRACVDIDDLDIRTIIKRSNSILEKRKKRKLKDNEILTEKIVSEAITLLNNNCIMLDSPIDGSNERFGGEPKTFSDVIEDPQKTAEEELVLKDSQKELIDLIRSYLDPVLSTIVLMRFLEKNPKSHEEIATILYSNKVTKKLLSKASISQKENIALKKLLVKDTRGILKNLLKENITTRNNMERV